MTTRRFSFNGVAGTNHYLALFRASDGYVFDFDAGVLDWVSTIGGATTPYVAATELTNLGGTGYSAYVADVDLSAINATSTPLQVIAQWFTNTGLTTPISDFSEYSIIGADLDDIPDTREIRGSVALADDGTVSVVGWLVKDGRNEALVSGSMDVAARIDSAGVDAWSATTSTVKDGYYFRATHALGTATPGENWLFKVTITDPDGATVTETFALQVG